MATASGAFLLGFHLLLTFIGRAAYQRRPVVLPAIAAAEPVFFVEAYPSSVVLEKAPLIGG